MCVTLVARIYRPPARLSETCDALGAAGIWRVRDLVEHPDALETIARLDMKLLERRRLEYATARVRERIAFEVRAVRERHRVPRRHPSASVDAPSADSGRARD